MLHFFLISFQLLLIEFSLLHILDILFFFVFLPLYLLATYIRTLNISTKQFLRFRVQQMLLLLYFFHNPILLLNVDTT